MSKAIKIRENTYEELLKLQRPRETISEVIDRLVRVYNEIFMIRETLGPHHHLAERPKEEVR